MPPQNESPGAAATAREASSVVNNTEHSRQHSLGQAQLPVLATGDFERAGAAILLGSRVRDEAILDALIHCDLEHQAAPVELLDRFYSAIDPDAAGGALAQIARAKFSRRRFTLDVEGDWSIIVPIRDCGMVIDLAAFSFDAPSQRAALRGFGYCVDLDQAQFESRLDKGDIRAHFDIWSYLRAGGSGALPVDWSETAFHLKRWKLGVVADDESQARLIDRRLRDALALPRVFWRKSQS